MLLSGVLARAGLFSLEEVFLVGTAGGFVGDSITYWIGSHFRKQADKISFFLKAKPRIEKLMGRFGWVTVFIVKYVYGLRTASALFWGVAHFGRVRFLLLTLVSCAYWVGLLAALGFTFATGVEKLIGDLKRVQIILLVVAVIVAIVYFIGRFERKVIEEEDE